MMGNISRIKNFPSFGWGHELGQFVNSNEFEEMRNQCSRGVAAIYKG